MITELSSRNMLMSQFNVDALYIHLYFWSESEQPKFKYFSIAFLTSYSAKLHA